MVKTQIQALTLVAITLLMAPASLAGEGLVESFTGKWQLKIEGRRGVQTPTMTVKEVDGKYAGQLHGARGSQTIKEISIDGATFSFPMLIKTPRGEMAVKYTGKINSDTLSGSIETRFGDVPFTGERKK